MSHRTRTPFLVALLGAWLPAACQQSGSPSDGLVDIYSTVIDSLKSGGVPGEIFLLDTAHPGLLSEFPLERLNADSDLTIAYFVANQRRDGPTNLLSEHLGIEVFDRGRFPVAPDEDPVEWWRRIADRYGTTELVFLQFGWPGLSADGDEAVLNYAVSCGPSCRSWHAARLQRFDGSWSRTADFMYQIN